MTDNTLETYLNNLMFRAARADADFLSEYSDLVRLEQATNQLREHRLRVLNALRGEERPLPVDNFGEAYQPSSAWRQ